MTSPTIETWRRRASPSELLRSAAECEPTSLRSSRRFLSTAGCRSTATTSRIMFFFNADVRLLTVHELVLCKTALQILVDAACQKGKRPVSLLLAD